MAARVNKGRKEETGSTNQTDRSMVKAGHMGAQNKVKGVKKKRRKRKKRKREWVWALTQLTKPNSFGLFNMLAQDPVGLNYPAHSRPKPNLLWTPERRIRSDPSPEIK
jgi:hypothetical protein